MNEPQYLLRFDDICPGMNWSVWGQIESILVERGLKPMLAVVPDNRDPGLQVDAPAEDFWDRVRGWQDRGWTIALHGFQHRYVSRNAGLVARRKKSEFAGLPQQEQRAKLRLGMDIFEREEITAQVWIAPGNTFDATTVALLPEVGIRVISAGYFQFPYVDRAGMTWVPQQMHYFRPAPAGVWTVCYHHSQWEPSRVGKFREEIEEYGANVVSLDEVLGKIGTRVTRPSETHEGTRVTRPSDMGVGISRWLCTHPRVSEFLIRGELKLWSWWNAPGERPRLAAPEICRPQPR